MKTIRVTSSSLITPPDSVFSYYHALMCIDEFAQQHLTWSESTLRNYTTNLFSHSKELSKLCIGLYFRLVIIASFLTYSDRQNVIELVEYLCQNLGHAIFYLDNYQLLRVQGFTNACILIIHSHSYT